jgi:hypothetical protein
MKKILIIFLVIMGCVIGCSHKPKIKRTEVILTFESDIPILVTVSKDCTENYNFCKWQ